MTRRLRAHGVPSRERAAGREACADGDSRGRGAGAFGAQYRPLAALALLVAAACSGAIEGGRGPTAMNGAGTGSGAGSGSGSGSGEQPGSGSVVTTPGVSAGVAPLRRLTAEQYRNSVRDLLGLGDAVAATALPADEVIAERFTTNVVRPLQNDDLDRYAEAAALIAAQVPGKLAALVPCAPAGGDAGCADKFIASFGRRAYRRPLTDAEVARLQALYTSAGNFSAGVRVVVQGILQSPNFLYLVESLPADAQSGQVVALDGYAVAARLSYFLWNSTPDEALLDAAGAGKLGRADDVAGEAGRLMRDARFRATAAQFHQAWLSFVELRGADKDATLFPTWNDALKTAMAGEAPRFVEHVFSEGDGRLATLLGARYSFLAGPLYDVYGVTKPAGGDWSKVELPARERAGLLTQAGLMAGLARGDRTSFVKRGKMLREALFCTEIPPPPPGVNDAEDMIPATASARERAEKHRQNPDCAGCHAVFDPMGFTFERYDAIGRYRAKDAAGNAIDASGEITGTAGLNGRVEDAVELIGKLAGDAEVRACVTRQWLRFALGRHESKDDEPSLEAAAKAFSASDGKVADLLLALARSDAFRHQKVR